MDTAEKLSALGYQLLRPLLFSQDPERAHHIGMQIMDVLAAAPACLRPDRVEDPVQLLGLTFPNRVGVAAGLDKNASHIDGLAALGFGFLELGTVTPLAQPGNPKPRLFRLPEAQAIINRFGFNNDGLADFVANVQRSSTWQKRQALERGALVENTPPVLGLNIGKNAATPLESATGDYLKGLARVWPLADYVAINISSPNTANLRKLQGSDELDGLLGALDTERRRLAEELGRGPPLLLKIAPDLDDDQVAVIIDALTRHHIDGVIATNTTLSRDAVQGLANATESGGLSGRPVFEASNRVIRALRAGLPARYPIIGVGGIMSGADAVAKIQAGADLVQLYSGLIYQGPSLVNAAARAIHGHDGTMR